MPLAFWQSFDPRDPGLASIILAWAVIAALQWVWLQHATRKGWSPWLGLAPALGIALATLLRIALTSGIDADESEHLHAAFALGRDVLPYRDLDQNHTPLLWMLTAPFLRLLPESPYVLFVFRALCLASSAASIAIACRISRTLVQGGSYQTPCCVLLSLLFATQAEFYRFRPDSFMNTLALGSLYLLVRPQPDAVQHKRVALLAGLLQGLAMAFSPKVGHLALLVPLLLWLRAPSDTGPGQRLRVAVAACARYAAGVLLGVAPVLLWLAWSGLLTDAYQGIVARNLGFAMRRVAAPTPQKIGFYNSVLEVKRLVEMAPFFVLAIAGAALAWVRRTPAPGLAPRAGRAVRGWVLGIELLWMSLWTFTPNAATYHIAGALLLGSAIAAPALDALVTRCNSARGQLGLALVIALCLGSAPLRAGIGGVVLGYSYPVSNVAWLLDEVRRRGDACLCIVPWHPIFIANVAPIYRSNEMRSGRWPEAVDWTLANRPAAVMAPRFAGLVQRGVLSETDRARMMEFLNVHYELVPAGTVGFWLLREN